MTQEQSFEEKFPSLKEIGIKYFDVRRTVDIREQNAQTQESWQEFMRFKNELWFTESIIETNCFDKQKVRNALDFLWNLSNQVTEFPDDILKPSVAREAYRKALTHIQEKLKELGL